MRVIPQLHFEYDESVMRAAHMTDLIDSALKADQKMKTSSIADPAKQPDSVNQPPVENNPE